MKSISAHLSVKLTQLGRTIEQLHHELSTASVYEALCLLDKCSGKVITTGLGKAGIAAQKAAATFSSLGIPAVYLDPATALHGDLGVVAEGDVMLAFSTSGKTREVLETLAYVPDVPIIAVTSHVDAPIRKMATVVLDMGPIKEIDHLGLAPTASFIAMVVVGDLLATILSEGRGWTSEDFGRVHHSGYLGQEARK